MNDWSNIVLAVSTIVLAWATVSLARYTRGLSRLTERIVSIETQRDERNAQAKGIRNLNRGLEAAIVVAKLHPKKVALQVRDLTALHISPTVTAIETLHSLKAYIADAIINPKLEYLCGVFDTARREPETKLNVDDIADAVNIVKQRL